MSKRIRIPTASVAQWAQHPITRSMPMRRMALTALARRLAFARLQELLPAWPHEYASALAAKSPKPDKAYAMGLRWGWKTALPGGQHGPWLTEILRALWGAEDSAEARTAAVGPWLAAAEACAYEGRAYPRFAEGTHMRTLQDRYDQIEFDREA